MTSSPSSIPAAFTALVALGHTAVTGIGGAVVADGWPDSVSPTMVGIGSEAPPFMATGQTNNVEGTPARIALGAIDVLEDYTIPGYVYVGQGGVNDSDVRAAAFAIWDSFFDGFNADPTLGVLNIWAKVAKFIVNGPRTPEEAQGGRFCLIQFWIQCQNQI